MITPLGDFKANETVYVPFHTFDSNDPSASVTITGLAVTDIEIYRDGSTTQRASDNGYTLLDTDGIDFDGITGLHGVSIDLSDNSDAGFYAAGSTYWVAVSSITVDGATINFWAAIFTIEKTGGVADILTDTEAVLTDTEAILTDSEAILADSEAILVDTGTTLLADTEAILSDTEATVADTNELQGDWADGGRLDLILDAVLTDTEAVLTDSEAILTDSEAILVDTGTTLLADTEAILADTNELQTDWVDGGRLDLILDAVLSDTEAVLTDSEAILTDSEAILVDTGTTLLADTEAILADSEAVLSDSEAILVDTGTTLLSDTEAILADSEAALADTESSLPTATLTESYRATGAQGTQAQLLYEILAHLGEHANSGTTKTLKKLDGSTTAKTCTYDDADNPTSITEAT